MLNRKVSILLKYYPDDYITRGSEGEIYATNEGVYKKFAWNVSIKKRNRKEQLLLFLTEIEELKPYYPEIRYLVTSLLNLYIKGYVMKPIIGGELDSSAYLIEERFNALLELKRILAIFRKHGLLYYDIRRPNIKLDSNHNPILLDIDGLLFEGEKLDATPYYIKKYIAKGGKLDIHAQTLMFNRFTQLCFQYNELEQEFIYDKEGKKIMTDSVKFDSAFDHEYLCDHMTLKKQL